MSVIDIETTGLDLQRDEILSIGAVQIRSGRISPDTFYEVCRPSRPISPEASKIHCLTSMDLAEAVTVDVCTERVARLVQGTTLVAHAAWVERAFLNRVLKGSRQRLPTRLVDTAALARAARIVPESDREPSLERLALSLNVPVHTPHHALGDAATTAVVLLALIASLEKERRVSLTTEELLRLSQEFGHG